MKTHKLSSKQVGNIIKILIDGKPIYQVTLYQDNDGAVDFEAVTVEPATEKVMRNHAVEQDESGSSFTYFLG